MEALNNLLEIYDETFRVRPVQNGIVLYDIEGRCDDVIYTFSTAVEYTAFINGMIALYKFSVKPKMNVSLEKNYISNQVIASLNIGDRVMILKTHQTGVVTKFNPYKRSENGLKYSTVSVKLDNGKTRCFTGRSLKKL